MPKKNSVFTSALSAITASLVLSTAVHAVESTRFALDVFPNESKQETDSGTAAQLTYLTTDAAADTNLYFHERSWSSDGSFIIFYSAREQGGLMGYIVATGELFRIATPSGGVGAATAALNKNSVFALRGNDVIELHITIVPAKNPKRKRSQVTAGERTICSLPPCSGSSALNENSNGTKLAIGRLGTDGSDLAVIYVIDHATGDTKEAYRVPTPPQYMSHVQWSHTSPNLLSFAGFYPRINVLDIDTGTVTAPYDQLRDELVTHEHWWVNDQIVFCGGTHPKPAEDAHVKVVDVKTGVTRILAAGSWWPNGTDEEVAKENYWHCAGSDDGRWVVADNWHGDITVIEGKNARPIVLTTGHRSYGKGDHPHVGWDRQGQQVIFTSYKLGDPNVCIATIPKAMQDANSTPAIAP
ncbi:MAG: hypothetical protein HUU46_10225 [Candidatus Hydrogenedentes bacterium]|nr:hypothetical protein [Candidatus Hydrogenedentota bacterium]